MQLINFEVAQLIIVIFKLVRSSACYLLRKLIFKNLQKPEIFLNNYIEKNQLLAISKGNLGKFSVIKVVCL